MDVRGWGAGDASNLVLGRGCSHKAGGQGVSSGLKLASGSRSAPPPGLGGGSEGWPSPKCQARLLKYINACNPHRPGTQAAAVVAALLHFTGEETEAQGKHLTQSYTRDRMRTRDSRSGGSTWPRLFSPPGPVQSHGSSTRLKYVHSRWPIDVASPSPGCLPGPRRNPKG